MDNMKLDLRKNLASVSKNISDALGKGVVEAVNQALEKISQPVNITINDMPPVKIEEAHHNKLPEVIKILHSRTPLFLVGEAGSGKTHLVEQAAKTLNLPFYCISVCGQTTASSLLGYMNATGQYVRTVFRDAYENGGVFLLDEIDNGNPNVLSVLNSAMANSLCSFPDGMIKKHKDFILCASGNTYGYGANRKYVGRLEIDAATLDRFVFMEIKYDEALENMICGNIDFAKIVQFVRKKVNEYQMRYIISPRSSVYGSKLIASGFDLDTALKMSVFKSMKDEDIARIFEQKPEEYEKIKKEIESKKEKENESEEGSEDNSEDSSEQKSKNELIESLPFNKDGNSSKENIGNTKPDIKDTNTNKDIVSLL